MLGNPPPFKAPFPKGAGAKGDRGVKKNVFMYICSNPPTSPCGEPTSLRKGRLI